MQRLLNLVFAAVIGTLVLAFHAEAAEQKVALALGGKFCDLSLGEVETSLKNVAA